MVDTTEQSAHNGGMTDTTKTLTVTIPADLALIVTDTLSNAMAGCHNRMEDWLVVPNGEPSDNRIAKAIRNARLAHSLRSARACFVRAERSTDV